MSLNGQKMTVHAQQKELSDIANRSTLLSRQMEKLLDDNSKMQLGVEYEREKLINDE